MFISRADPSVCGKGGICVTRKDSVRDTRLVASLLTVCCTVTNTTRLGSVRFELGGASYSPGLTSCDFILPLPKIRWP